MPRFARTIAIALLVCLLPALGAAQGRITGQIVGTVKDAQGAVVPKADLVLIDSGTGATVETKSGSDGNFVFPNLQPGRYQITATFTGFQPVTIQEVIVQTARSIDVVVQFEVAGLNEQVQVEGRSQVVETTSSTIANTVTNAQIAKLPMAGRNILNFALLVPGAATSSGGRDSEYNGLPGGAINITLDGVNNNSARFRSGGTSMFVFAPVRLGAIEEVTVSTSGLTADAGAEGAVQLQFVTKRGTNTFRGQVFDQISSDRLNAQGAVNKSRGTPKNKLKQHEWGANMGGPIVKNKLFFFGNYERIYQPGETTINRTVLTAEAQRGVFRYLDANGVTQTRDLFEIASRPAFNLPTALDPYVQRQLQTINNTLNQGIITPGGSLITNNFGFVIEQTPNVNYYPTARVDYQATSNLAVRGVLNLHYRDLPTNMRYPGLPRINDGFASTYYILSTGADWTLKPNLFYQVSFGGQSNYEEFRPGNTLDIYAGGLNGMRVDLPNALIDEPEIVGDQLPIPRNNPVWNVTNALTWLKGKHTMTFGGTYRRTTMYESIGGIPPVYTVGIGTGDPAANAFTTTTLPFIRDADRTNALALYALLVGRVSNASGQYNLNTDSKVYELIPALRKEAQNVGGIYAQDQWRLSPTLTLNYGLRWEFSGAATNPSDVYSGPEPSGILGPSSALFQPGTLNGDLNPQILLKPKPYKSDFNNPAPNVGVAWNPSKPAGFLGKLLGQAVYRANFGINYYDEGLISFQTAAGNGPGLLQTLALPAFMPGSLNLQTPLPPFTRTPTEFTFPLSMSGFTFNRGHSTFDPDIQTPMVKNWSIGYQRELTRYSAIEVRYVGNRGSSLWRLYNLNETNIFENGFLREFQNAQRNLAINVADGRTGFANQGLPGQVALPIFEAAFGARGSQGTLPGSSGFTNTTFITQLNQGQAGRLANTMAGTDLYLCRMVGSALPACNARGYNAAGVYPINFFQANPLAAGSNARLMTDESSSAYDSLQLQFRQRVRQGLSVTANYTYGKGRTDRYQISADNTADWSTLRDRSLNWGPTGYDLRHIFQAYGTYELPFGKGRHFNIDNPILDQAFGGWAASAIMKWQTGRPFLLTSGRQTFNQQDAGVILNGITVEELQKMVKVSTPPANDGRFAVGNVLYLDPRLIGPDGRANPEFLRYPTTAGEFGQFVYLYGPGLIVADLSVAKTFHLGGQRRFNFEALFINAFNHRNTTVGGNGGTSISIDSTTFGQSSGVANVSTNGARQVQFRVGYYF